MIEILEPKDLSYHRRRASAETEAAHKSRDPAVKASHYKLAELHMMAFRRTQFD
jgi:hypothetical protein